MTTRTAIKLDVMRGARRVARITLRPRKVGRNVVTFLAPSPAGAYQLRIMHGTARLDHASLVVVKPKPNTKPKPKPKPNAKRRT